MNNNVGEKYLPVGTVVILNGAEKRLMITGFGVASEVSKGELYDYSGCLYPEGIVSKETAVFNHDQIEKVFHLGLIDDEEKKFKANLVRAIDATKSAFSNKSESNIGGQPNIVDNSMMTNTLELKSNAVVPDLMGNSAPSNEVVMPNTFAVPTTGVPDLMGQQQSQPVSQQSNEQNGLPSVNRFLTNFE